MSIIDQCKSLHEKATSPTLVSKDKLAAALTLASMFPAILAELEMFREQSRSDVHRAFTEFRKRVGTKRAAAGERERKLSQDNDPTARFYGGMDSGLGAAVTISIEIGEEWPLVKVDEGGE